MITINDLLTHIKDVLSTVKEYEFNIFIDAGKYLEAKRNRNTVTNYINGLLTVGEPETQYLNGGTMIAVGIGARLEFLVPVGDEESPTGEYPAMTAFRNALSEVFGKATAVNIKDSDGRVYTGGASYNLPATGQLSVRDLVGVSMTYSCALSFAYLENAVNTADISLEIDGERVAFQSIRIARNPALSADILAHSENGENSVYSESAAMKIEFSVPALKGVAHSAAIMYWLLGTEKANTVHEVTLTVPTMEQDKEAYCSRTLQMVFGGGETTGSGVSNLVYNISLVPYTAAEIVGG